MARKPRIHFKNAYYHVVLSGEPKRPLFLHDDDRQFWEGLVAEGLVRFGYRVHAYCWLDTQASMVVQVGEQPLAKCIQNLTFRYTRYSNVTYGLSGPLFRGRYKAIVIDPDEYLGDLTCYIHSLPLQDAPESDPAQYAWSSLPSYLGVQQVDWLTKQAVDQNIFQPTDLLKSSGTSGDRPADLDDSRLFFQRAPEISEVNLFCRGVGSDCGDSRILGSERFVRRVLKPGRKITYPVTLIEVARYVCRQEDVNEAHLKLPSRDRHRSCVRQTIAWLVTELQVATLSDVGRRYNRDLSTMSRNQRNFKLRMEKDAQLTKTVRRYKRALIGLSTSSC